MQLGVGLRPGASILVTHAHPIYDAIGLKNVAVQSSGQSISQLPLIEEQRTIIALMACSFSAITVESDDSLILDAPEHSSHPLTPLHPDAPCVRFFRHLSITDTLLFINLVRNEYFGVPYDHCKTIFFFFFFFYV